MKKTDTGYATGAGAALSAAPFAAPLIDANILAPGDWRGAT